jgi:hypothetical protein
MVLFEALTRPFFDIVWRPAGIVAQSSLLAGCGDISPSNSWFPHRDGAENWSLDCRAAVMAKHSSQIHRRMSRVRL